MDSDKLKRPGQERGPAEEREGPESNSGPRQLQVLRLRQQRARRYHKRNAGFVEEFNKLTESKCAGNEGGVSMRAVHRWQVEHGLRGDGLVGPETLAKAREVGGQAKPEAKTDTNGASPIRAPQPMGKLQAREIRRRAMLQAPKPLQAKRKVCPQRLRRLMHLRKPTLTVARRLVRQRLPPHLLAQPQPRQSDQHRALRRSEFRAANRTRK